MAKLLTEEQDKYLREIAPGKNVTECVELINTKFGTSFTYKQIRAYKHNHKITSGLRGYQFVDHNKRKLFNDEQVQWLKDNAKGVYNKDLTVMFNKHFGTSMTVGQIETVKNRYHISSGITGWFEKGQISHNKGKKMPPEIYEKCKATMFKKGNVPYNYKEVGTEQWLDDGFLWVKVDDQPNVSKGVNWIQKHRYIWKQHHGEIPEGYKVIFLDGDRTNITIENLGLVSNSEMLIMNKNGLIYDDPELTEVGMNVARLLNATSKKKVKKP